MQSLTKYVKRLIDEHSVKQHQILGRLAPSDIELPALIAHYDHARKRSQIRGQITRYIGSGHAFDVLGLDPLQASDQVHHAPLLLGLHHQFAE